MNNAQIGVILSEAKNLAEWRTTKLDLVEIVQTPPQILRRPPQVDSSE